MGKGDKTRDETSKKGGNLHDDDDKIEERQIGNREYPESNLLENNVNVYLLSGKSLT